MRREILKFLSDTHEYKPLNEFLKTFQNVPLQAIISTINEMIESRSSVNVIEIKGDFRFLGQQFADTVNFGKVLSFRHEGDIPPHGIKIISRGIGDLDNCQFEARILHTGRKELEEHELQLSIKRVNDSVVITNRSILVISILAAGFSLASLLIALFKDEKVHIQELTQTNSILQSQVQVLQNLLSKVPDSSYQIGGHIDSLGKK